jgi:hypothetical protein
MFLLCLTACTSITARKHQQAESVLSPDYWHPPPSASVVERRLYVGMSGDEFLRLVGAQDPGFASPLPWWHYFLPDGTFSVAFDPEGRVSEWKVARGTK